MALTIEPSIAEFPETGGVTQHMVVNVGGSRIAFKVKCSDNNLFTVRPVFAFVEPGQATGVEVTRKAGPAKQDKLVLQYAEAAPEEQDPQAPFRVPSQYLDTTLLLIVGVPAGEQQPAEV
jgi:hypothetical protein